MGRHGKFVLFGLSLAIAILGVFLFLSRPANAGDPPDQCEAGSQQGMVAANLGV
jgi:hypothetical protein